MATRPATELDFDQLKADIIEYISSNPTYSDYNFQGSALNAIADLLAYNTHNNAYYANMLHNESFLDTAQRRSSVVSKAKELGYTPKSVVCSTAFVDISVFGLSNSNSIILERGVQFSSSNDNGGFSFSVAEDVSSVNVNGIVSLNSVKLVDGIRVQNYFTVNTTANIRSIFPIPNKNIDTSTLKVYVRDTLASVNRTEYFLVDDIFSLTPTSTAFFLQESYDGYFQIYFGNGVLGAQPVNNNVIDVDYFISENLELADGCGTFGFDGTIGDSDSISILTTQVSFGGSDKEAIESIRVNAIKSNSAKNRSVIADDYELKIKELFTFVKSVSVWGGEDNIPPVYGKVFISIQPVSGYTISDTVKRDIIAPAIKKTSMLTIIPEFIDPEYLNMEFVTTIKFNQTKTITSQGAVIVGVQTAVEDYVSSISEFNKDYLESTLIESILNVDPGIVSASVSKRVGFRMTPLTGVVSSHTRSVNNQIVPDTITSTSFNAFYEDSIVVVYIKEIPNKSNVVTVNGIEETYHFMGVYSLGGLLMEEIGTVNLTRGDFNIAFGVNSYLSSNRFISMRCNLVDMDVVVDRNHILNIEPVTIDTTIGLAYNNTINVELYGK